MLKTYIAAREAVINVVRNEEGASLAEYALLIALVLIGVGVALSALTTAVNGALSEGINCLNGTATECMP